MAVTGTVGERAARGAAWNVATSVGTRVLGLVGTLVITRFVAPTEAGEISAAAVWVLTATQLTNLRFGQYLIAKRASPDVAYQANVVHFAVGLVAVGLVYVLRGVIGGWVDAPAMARFIPGFAATALIERLQYIPERTLVRDLRFRELSVARSIGEVVFTLTSLAVAPRYGGMGIIAGNLTRAVITTYLILRASTWADWARRAPLRWNTVREMLRYCLPLWIGSFAEFASTRWDNLLVSRFFGPKQLGMYNLAYNLADTPTGAVGEQIGDVLFPSFSKLEERHRIDALVRATKLMALIVFPMAVGLGAVAPTVVRVLFDQRWLGVAPMLAVLSVLSIAKPVCWPVLSYMQAQHRQSALMYLAFAKLVVLLAAIGTFGRLGPLWTCAAVGITLGAYTLACMICARVLDGVPVMRILFGVLPVSGACLLMAMAVFGVRAAMQHAGHGPSWGSFAIEILAGGATYCVASLLLARPTCDELITQIRRVIRRRAQA